MGFLFGDNDHSDSNRLVEEQIRQNRAELAAKTKSLYQTRLDIIKGQGAQVWEPDKSSKQPPKPRFDFPFLGKPLG